MNLEDLLKDTKDITKKRLEKAWKDSGLLDGLKPSGDTNMALLLESQPKQKINEFRSAGVYAIDRDDGIRYSAEESMLINSMVEDVISNFEESKGSIEIPDYLLNDSEVVGYPDLEMQKEIYDWVRKDLPFTGYSVKDLGAGRGDFYGYAPSRQHKVSYIGFEKKESLVLAGRKKYPDIELIQEDFLEDVTYTDYTICIGTLNEYHNSDKWKYFNKILNHALSNTKIAIIFILASNMDGNPDFLDYPFEELFLHLPKDIRFSIDYTRMEDIYKLTVHIGGYDD